jgi:hypothetical protein
MGVTWHETVLVFLYGRVWRRKQDASRSDIMITHHPTPADSDLVLASVRTALALL